MTTKKKAINPVQEELDHHHGRLKQGDKRALFDALAACASFGVPMPKWLAHAFLKGYLAVATFKSKSWDNAFGQPHPKNTQLEAARLHAELAFPVLMHIAQAQERGEAVDDDLFHAVAQKLRVGGKDKDGEYQGASTVRDVYRAARRAYASNR